MATKKMLIAAVLVTCYVNGVRTDVQPGEPVPELSPHDEAELKRMGAVVDAADEVRAEQQDDEAAAQHDAEFEAARRRVQAADQSLTDGAPADQAEPADAPPTADPAAAAAATGKGRKAKA